MKEIRASHADGFVHRLVRPRTLVAVVMSAVAIGAATVVANEQASTPARAVHDSAAVVGTSPAPLATTSPLASSTVSFDAAGAVSWAEDNVDSSLGGLITGDDCTDFVSRALYLGGGLPMVFDAAGGDRTNDANWFNWQVYLHGQAAGMSYSWAASNHLERYLKTSGRGHQVDRAHAAPGDVIFVNWGPGGRDTPTGNPAGEDGISHAGLVVGNPGVTGGYNLSIAQHSRNIIETLADWRGPNPNLQVWIYRIG